jgi:hypothetical protein
MESIQSKLLRAKPPVEPAALVKRLWRGVLWAALGLGCSLSVWALPAGHVPAAPVHDAEEAADLADASADSPVLRALSASARKALADKGAVPDVPAKPASTPVAAKPERTLAEEARSTAKDLAVQSGVVGAKEFLNAELGLDKPADASADALAENRRAMRQSATGGGDSADNALPGNPHLPKPDEAQISFLASALVREVMPWAIGGAALLASIQGIRLMLAYAQRKNERKRKFRRTSRRR